MQHGVDRTGLNGVRRRPGKPAAACVFGRGDFVLGADVPEKQNQCFQHTIGLLATVTTAGHFVLLFIAKRRVDLYAIARDSGFFFHFPQRTFEIGFTGINMPFGEIPAVRMPHQEKGRNRIPGDQDDATGTGRRKFSHDDSAYRTRDARPIT